MSVHEAQRGRVACPVGVTLRFEGEGPDHTVIRVAGPLDMLEEVDLVMTEVYDALLDRGLPEEAIEEPVVLTVGEEPLAIEDMPRSPDVPSDGGEIVGGGVPRGVGETHSGGVPRFSSLQLAAMFGDRGEFRMGGPRVEWNFNAGRGCVWFAVRITRLLGGGVA